MRNIIDKAKEAQDEKISEEHAFSLGKQLSNWLKVSDIIYSKDVKEPMVLALLGYEREHRQREYVMKRIYSRYSSMRLQREYKELVTCIMNLKASPKL